MASAPPPPIRPAARPRDFIVSSFCLNRRLMTSNHDLRSVKIPLNFGTGAIPALGFGTLIPDPAETKSATTNALRVGFRHFDCAERYRNEREVGESLHAE